MKINVGSYSDNSFYAKFMRAALFPVRGIMLALIDFKLKGSDSGLVNTPPFFNQINKFYMVDFKLDKIPNGNLLSNNLRSLPQIVKDQLAANGFDFYPFDGGFKPTFCTTSTISQDLDSYRSTLFIVDKGTHKTLCLFSHKKTVSDVSRSFGYVDIINDFNNVLLNQIDYQTGAIQPGTYPGLDQLIQNALASDPS